MQVDSAKKASQDEDVGRWMGCCDGVWHLQ